MVSASNDLINELLIKKNTLRVSVNEHFKKRFLVDDFFVEYDEAIDLEQLPRSLVMLSFVLTIFSAVWVSGETYYLDSMDSDVYNGLEKLKKIYEILYPKTLWYGQLIPRKLVKTLPLDCPLDGRTHVALLFSGGLDSIVSSLCHSDKKQLLITAWGQYDTPLHNKPVWDVAKKHVLTFAQKYGHENSFIRSNYAEFFNHEALEKISPEIFQWRLHAVEDIGWIGLVAPILYTKGYSSLLIASSDTWAFSYPTASGPFVDSTMKFSGLRLAHDLFNSTRLEKVEYLASYLKGKEKPYLRVCQRGGLHNCTDCWKCRATIMALFASGENPEEYGFFTTMDEMRPRVEAYLRGDVKSLTALECFIHIQEKIQQRLDSGDVSAQKLQWILDINIRGMINMTFESNYQQLIPWKELQVLCPEIEVPHYYLDPHYKHPLEMPSEKKSSRSILGWLKSIVSYVIS